MTDAQINALIRYLFDSGITLREITWDRTTVTRQVIVKYWDGGQNRHWVGINPSGTVTTYEE